jgi:hypothetical protein
VTPKSTIILQNATGSTWDRRLTETCKESNGFMKAITRSTLAGVACFVIAAGASAALAATPTFPTFSGPPSKTNPVVKPSEILYTGDGSEFFAGEGSKKAGKLHWTVWNSTEGLGTGDQWIDNCTPNCASGKFSKFPVTLKTYQPKKASKYFIFTRLKVTYTGKKPGHQKTFTWKVSYNHGIFLIG